MVENKFSATKEGHGLHAALRSTLGAAWSPQVWKEVRGQEADLNFRKCYQHRYLAHKQSLLSKRKEVVQRWAKKRKRERQLAGQSQQAKMAYGENSIQVESDIPTASLVESCALHYDKHVRISTHKIKLSVAHGTQSVEAG